MSQYRKYNITFSVILIAIIAGVASFNMLIDPFGVWRTPEIYGFNQGKFAKYQNQLLFKTADVINLKPTAIILGASNTIFGIDPAYYQQITGQQIYNLAFTDANIYEEMRYLEHALYNQPNLQQVIIGIDFFSFNKEKHNRKDFDDHRIATSHFIKDDIIKTTLSLDGTIQSIKTLKANREMPDFQSFYSNGHSTEAGIRRDWIQNRSTLTIVTDVARLTLNDPEYLKNFKISPERMDQFRQIVEICRQRNIDLKIFISPANAAATEIVRAAGLWTELEQWKRDIVQIVPVWDFSDYNTVTSESVYEPMVYFWDYTHYHNQVGNFVLDRLCGVHSTTVPNDFGKWLTPDNIEQHLDVIRDRRATWAEKNMQTVHMIQQLKKE